MSLYMKGNLKEEKILVNNPAQRKIERIMPRSDYTAVRQCISSFNENKM